MVESEKLNCTTKYLTQLTDVVITELHCNLMYGDKKFPNSEKFKIHADKHGGLLTQAPRNVETSPARALCKCLVSKCMLCCSVHNVVWGNIRCCCESRTEHKTQAVVRDLDCDLFFPHPDIHYPVILYLSLYPILSH